MTSAGRSHTFGEVFAVPDRGVFMGNRGVLHDHQ